MSVKTSRPMFCALVSIDKQGWCLADRITQAAQSYLERPAGVCVPLLIALREQGNEQNVSVSI